MPRNLTSYEQETVINFNKAAETPRKEGIKQACELVKSNLASLNYEEKRLALKTLQIKVMVNAPNINIEGVISIQPHSIESFPEESVIKENEKINRQRADLIERRIELETKINQAREAEVDIEGIERFCALVRQSLKDFTFEDKRLALEALQTEIWVDDDTIAGLGSIPIIEGILYPLDAGGVDTMQPPLSPLN